MKLFLLVILLHPCFAGARMLESLEEVVQRYGYPADQSAVTTIHRRDSGEGTLKYLNKPIKVIMRFFGKKVIMIEYFKGEPMTQSELSGLLERNSVGWKVYKDEDSEVVKIRKLLTQIRDFEKDEKIERKSSDTLFYNGVFVATYNSEAGYLVIWSQLFSSYLFPVPQGAVLPTDSLKGL
jgi:hypothetical protein